jgi:hypothetical protein
MLLALGLLTEMTVARYVKRYAAFYGKTNMGDRTISDRMARMRQRRKEAGLVEARVWVRPEVLPLVQDIAQHVSPERVPLLRDVVRYGIQVKANTPPPATARPGGQLAAEERVDIRVAFPQVPHLGLREKLTAISLKRVADGSRTRNAVWAGAVLERDLSTLVPSIEAAGGKITRV